MDEWQALLSTVAGLKVLSPEGKAYLLDRFYSDKEISDEFRRRYLRRINGIQPQASHHRSCSQESQ